MNEYALRVGDAGGVAVTFAVKAESRFEAVEKARRALAKGVGGTEVPITGELPGGEVGFAAVSVHPDELLKDCITEGPYDPADHCPECGHAPIERVGQPCELAERSMPVEDYFGDGARYVPVGTHTSGWRCTNPDCEAEDADACVHD